MNFEPQHISNDERGQILSALYGELPKQERAAWEQLCAQKPHIADEYEHLRRTMFILSEQEPSDESAFFATQWKTLESMMKSDTASSSMPVSIAIPKARIFTLASPQMRRWYMAAATFLLTLGVGISVYTWQQSEERKRTATTVISDSVQPAPVLLSMPSMRGELTQKESSQAPSEQRRTSAKTPQPALQQTPQSFEDIMPSSEIKQESRPEALKPEILKDEAKKDEVKKEETKKEDVEYNSAPMNENPKAAPILAPRTSPTLTFPTELNGIMKMQAAPSGRAMEERSLTLPQKRTIAATKATIRLDSSQIRARDSIRQQPEKK